MKKISSLTSTATSDGLFTNGSVATGVSPTILDAGWFNTVQNELVNIVQSSGVGLDPADDTQVLAALKKLLKGRALPPVVMTASGTYTPRSTARRVIVQLVGGGASGSSGTTSTSASYTSSGGGGGGAGYVEFEIDLTVATISKVQVTIGSGGPAVTGKQGVSGGRTSFGDNIYATGGSPGSLGTRPASDYQNTTSSLMVIPGVPGVGVFGETASGYRLIRKANGCYGGWGYLGTQGQLGGAGGNSVLSGTASAAGNAGNGNDGASAGPGAGGSGSCTLYDTNTPTAFIYTAKPSGAGANGIAIFWEFE